ncbi:MAG: EamA family transporter [Bdellovibrionales bacterium]|nr:EamA family transporter [Bdellovibrionales bacterium]
MNWTTLALLSALFAGLTAILAKLGVEEIPSNLATLIRTVVVAIFALGIVIAQGQFDELPRISTRTWTFLVLSGLATGLSWLFYFAALKAGPVSGVAPIDKLSFVIAIILGLFFLGEKLSGLSLVGVCFISTGVLLTLPGVQAFLKSHLFE